jgi:hypothetical protein
MTQPELEEKRKTLDPVKIEHDQTHTHTTREQKRQEHKIQENKNVKNIKRKRETEAVGKNRTPAPPDGNEKHNTTEKKRTQGRKR